METIRDGFTNSEILVINIIIFAVIISLIGFVLQFGNLYVHSRPDVSDFWKLLCHDFVLAVTLVADIVVFHTIWDLVDDIFYTGPVTDELAALRRMKITGTDIFKVIKFRPLLSQWLQERDRAILGGKSLNVGPLMKVKTPKELQSCENFDFLTVKSNLSPFLNPLSILD